MPAVPIADFLKSDIVDRTAAAVISANPAGTFINGVSSVPVYLYQSLKTLWTGASASLSSYQSKIVANLGTLEATSEGSIVVLSRTVDESVSKRSSFRSDQAGSEVATINILLYKPKTLATLQPISIDVVQNAALRIRYLIDNHLRGSRGQAGNIPQYFVSLDPSIDLRTPLYCFWNGHGEPILASQATLSFRADYVRMFAR